MMTDSEKLNSNSEIRGTEYIPYFVPIVSLVPDRESSGYCEMEVPIWLNPKREHELAVQAEGRITYQDGSSLVHDKVDTLPEWIVRKGGRIIAMPAEPEQISETG